jgi:hypothetical protein
MQRYEPNSAVLHHGIGKVHLPKISFRLASLPKKINENEEYIDITTPLVSKTKYFKMKPIPTFELLEAPKSKKTVKFHRTRRALL